MVFNIQRYSIDDGPGIRSTVFLKGCPLKCLWCSNPESQNPGPEVTHRDSVCSRCGRCMEVCDTGAVTVDGRGVHIDRKNCVRCGKCVEVCLPEALRFIGREMSVDEVFEEVARDMDYYRHSGGGVTVSGGEVLSQPDFAEALLKRCRNAGMHTCIDTSGYGDTAALNKILPHASLVLFDLKHADSDKHRELTGRGNELILKNLALVANRGVSVIIRVPVIPGYNDGDDEIAAIASIVTNMTKSAPVNLMPYHGYGTGKYKMLDLEYKLGELARPTDAKLERAKRIIESLGLNCEIVL